MNDLNELNYIHHWLKLEVKEERKKNEMFKNKKTTKLEN